MPEDYDLVRVSSELLNELTDRESEPVVFVKVEQFDDKTCELIVRYPGFRDLVRIAQRMLDEHYPPDLFGEDGLFRDDPGSRFTQHLRAALAVIAEVDASKETEA